MDTPGGQRDSRGTGYGKETQHHLQKIQEGGVGPGQWGQAKKPLTVRAQWGAF